MDFVIQTSCPFPTIQCDGTEETLCEAVEKVFPLKTEFAFLVWNNTFIPLSYKYDVSVILDDVLYLVDLVIKEDAGEVEIDWPSNTFSANWNVSWINDDLLIESTWYSVIGGAEDNLNNFNRLSVSRDAFLVEWTQLLRKVLDGLTCAKCMLKSDLQFLKEICEMTEKKGELYNNAS